MDPGTGLTILGTAVGGAKLVEKLLGPTAEYLGNGLQTWTQKRVENVGRIFTKATERLGDRVDTTGSVPPKLLKGILDEGSYCDDALGAEYLAGILANGRTESGRDDRSSTFIKLTSQLSTYEIRLHFIAYSCIRRLFVGDKLRPTFGEDLQKMLVHLPGTLIGTAMDFTQSEPASEIMQHCINGLARNDLIDIPFYGSREHVNQTGEAMFRQRWNSVTEDGWSIVGAPTAHGIELFLWGIGATSVDISDFLKPELTLVDPDGVTIPESASRVLADAT